MEPEEDITALYALVAHSGNLDIVFERLGSFDPDLPLGALPPRPRYLCRRWTSLVGEEQASHPVLRLLQLRDAEGASKAGSTAATAAFGILATHFGGPLATYASVVFVQEAIGDALDEAVIRHFRAWCGADWRETAKDGHSEATPPRGSA